MSIAQNIVVSVIASIIVFIISENLKQIWVQPLQKYKELKQKVGFTIIYYANIYHNPIDLSEYPSETVERYKKASEEIRNLSAEVDGFIETLPLVKINIPSKKDLHDVSKELMGLSNGLFLPYENKKQMYYSTVKNNMDGVEIIREKLNLYSAREKE